MAYTDYFSMIANNQEIILGVAPLSSFSKPLIKRLTFTSIADEKWALLPDSLGSELNVPLN